MSQFINPTAVMSIDLKKNRIRISKQTLYLFGKPEYLQLLVNPNRKVVALKGVDLAGRFSHRINWPALCTRNSCELYSSQLVQSLYSLCPIWEQNKSYHLKGDLVQEMKLVLFVLSNAQHTVDVLCKGE